ncbi:hypothetical protein TIFTF001_025589 [Ficus carica]|uniref:glycerophosphodiester phosphodiesterase n=1 Tax=Ficus carica TaxID=3494 RepID=A0AA88AX05_FICCA|nr:hypothetical protein TIFTF001_025589 [Ficus carica]
MAMAMAMGRSRSRRGALNQSQSERHGGRGGGGGLLFPIRLSSPKRLIRKIIISLVVIALLPPIFLHFRLRRLHQIQLNKCGWLHNPPFVCAHGGDSSNAFPNTMAAYESAIQSRVDCIEIDVSRSSDGVLFALHDSKGDYMTCFALRIMQAIKELGTVHQAAQNFDGGTVPTIEDALKFVSGSVRQVILDAKVGPPSYEKGMAKDILSVASYLPAVNPTTNYYVKGIETHIIRCYFLVALTLKSMATITPCFNLVAMHDDITNVKRTQCKNCLVWAKSDNLARDVIKQSSDTMVGYIVMIDPTTGLRTNLLRMKGAAVVGVYHPLIDEKLVRILHGRSKKVYAWTVDDVNSMQKMLFERVDAVVTSNPTHLQRLMQDTRTQCLEEGFSFSQ